VTQQEFISSEPQRISRFKIDNERIFATELRGYFKKQQGLVKNGKDIQTISPILERQYKRIANGLTDKQLVQAQNATIQKGVESVIQKRLDEQPAIIDQTTADLWDIALERAREQLADEGDPNLNNKILLLVAARIFGARNKSRVTNIAMTETQGATESMRSVITEEAHKELTDVIVDRDKERATELWELSRDYTSYKIQDAITVATTALLFKKLEEAIKEWVNMGDGKVRTGKFNHVIAGGQQIKTDEPFIVSGEQLMYPGDTSLGASMGNIARCRCNALYI